MSDQCKNCTSKGDIKKCLDTECSKHEDWIFLFLGNETAKQHKLNAALVQMVKLLDTNNEDKKMLIEMLKEANNKFNILFNEVDCRIEHGAESGGHLEYVRSKLNEIKKLFCVIK